MPALFGLRSYLTASLSLPPLLQPQSRLIRLGLASCAVLGIALGGTIALSEIASSVLTERVSSEEFVPATRAAILDRLADANVIYLGEYHDRPYDHAAQLEIIRELQARNPKLTIAMEMFQRPFQGAIDAYLAGEIDEAALIEQTEYETRWGFPWELYAPILQFARDAEIPVIAANAPTELTRKVSAQGLTGLSGDDFRHIPPIAEIRLDDVNYRSALYDLFQMHMKLWSGESGASEASGESSTAQEEEQTAEYPTEADDGFERFFAAQVLWDETMAAAIAQAYHNDPDRQIIVIAGRGHIAYNFGIPNRVQRRVRLISGDRAMIEPEEYQPSPASPESFAQMSIFFAQNDVDRESLWTIPSHLDQSLVDYFWSF